MRLSSVYLCCLLAGAFAVSACEKLTSPDVDKRADVVNVIDATNLNDIMLTVADPNEAVAYFQRALSQEPDRVDFRRGLAKSLIRAGRAAEALPILEKLTASKDATSEDRLDYADALIRNNAWDKAEVQLRQIPPTYETYDRYRLEAMVADSNKDWARADSFYETAAGMTTKPAGIYNNWGYSKLTRGEYSGAEDLFLQAITYNSELFTAKNNLILARAAQGKYSLPPIHLTQTEKAELLYTMAIAAIKKGDVDVGHGLLLEAIDIHPQHFDAAVRALDALERAKSS
jgi:Flp pilus assembly protein TadD